jgi:hypothetical protein
MGQVDPCVRFGEQLRPANEAYWSRFIEARHEVITETTTLLSDALEKNKDNGWGLAALASLAAAQHQLDHAITADNCVNFIDAWQDDLEDWQRFSSRVDNVGNTRDAMDFLQLNSWTRSEFGTAAVESNNASGWFRKPAPH